MRKFTIHGVENAHRTRTRYQRAYLSRGKRRVVGHKEQSFESHGVLLLQKLVPLAENLRAR